MHKEISYRAGLLRIKYSWIIEDETVEINGFSKPIPLSNILIAYKSQKGTRIYIYGVLDELEAGDFETIAFRLMHIYRERRSGTPSIFEREDKEGLSLEYQASFMLKDALKTSKFHAFSESIDPKNDSDEILEHIKSKSRHDEFAALLATLYSDATYSSKALREHEFRKKCNVCGTVFCYTLDDVEKNVARAFSNAAGSLAQLGGIATGNAGASIYGRLAQVPITDFKKCPNCNSSNLSDWDPEESTAAQISTPSSYSEADEILKYKNLMDQGIITQEEFEAKKKQLLGL